MASMSMHGEMDIADALSNDGDLLRNYVEMLDRLQQEKMRKAGRTLKGVLHLLGRGRDQETQRVDQTMAEIANQANAEATKVMMDARELNEHIIMTEKQADAARFH